MRLLGIRPALLRYGMACAMLAGIAAVHAQVPQRAALLKALQRGGYVIVMRHASSPHALPDPAHTDPENVGRERQLNDAGRASARSMGEALHRLTIPIGRVLSSPAYRALQTAHLARLASPEAVTELGLSGGSMQADTNGTRAQWLRAKAAELPLSGTNTILITHLPNIKEAFPDDASDLTDGEALIFLPDGRGGSSLKARVKIDEWADISAAH